MNLRDDKLWDDLRYWLAHPVTEDEQEKRDIEINEYINSVLAKTYGNS